MDSGVTTNFHDFEPGWTCIFFETPPRLKKSRAHVLLQSLETWRQHYPMRRIESIQFVKHKQLVRGLNILWTPFEHLQEQSKIVHFNIHQDVRDLYGHEYNEALMADAIQFANDNPAPTANVVLVSRRRIAIVITRHDQHAYVLTFDQFLSTFPEDHRPKVIGDFDAWIATNEQGYFCAILPDEYRISMN
jgi:hypothetical protein